MAVFCSQINLLFLCVGKAGCTSIADLLTNHHGGRWIPEHHIWDTGKNRILVDKKHSELKQLLSERLLSENAVGRCNVIVNTRNPYAWVVSKYLFSVQCYRRSFEKNPPEWILGWLHELRQIATQPFEEYVKNAFHNKTCSVYRKYIDGAYCIHPDRLHIIRIEHVSAEINQVFAHLGVPNREPIKHLNVTQGRRLPYQQYYTSTTKSIVENSFAQDIEELKYAF